MKPSFRLVVFCFAVFAVDICQATPSIVDCTFEESTCSWQNGPRQELTWERTAGRPGSWLTGPSADHTLGTGRGRYLSVSTAGNQRHGDIQKSSYISPVIGSASLDQDACFSFWYLMYGPHIGHLNVFLGHANPSRGARQKIWTKSRSQGPEWKHGHIDIPGGRADSYVVFEVITTGYPALHAAIDDVIMTSGTCPPSVSCDFDHGVCGYNLSVSDNLTWIRSSSEISDVKSQFPRDHTYGSEDGHFIYLDLRGLQFPRQDIAIQSPLSTPTRGSCFYFWYSLASEKSEVSILISLDKIETLGVNKNSAISVKTLNLTSFPNHSWQLASVNITSGYEFRLLLSAKVVGIMNVIIAIDDIDIIPGYCPSVDMCDFEHSQCSWDNSAEDDDFDWIRARGGELYIASTGRIDHTLRTIYGNYLLLNNNKMESIENKARLISKWLPQNTEHCLSIWYLIEDTEGTKINIRTLSNNTDPPFTLEHSDGMQNPTPFWKQLRHTIPRGSRPFRIELEGVVGTGSNSYIALDDVSIQEGSCSSVVNTAEKYVFQCERLEKALTYRQVCDFTEDCPHGEEERDCGYNCDFEELSCKWTDRSSDRSYWLLSDGKSYGQLYPRSSRGSIRDHTKFSYSGHFMAVVSGSDSTADNNIADSTLSSPVFKRSAITCKMTLYYMTTNPGSWRLRVEKEVRGYAVNHYHLANATARYWRKLDVHIGHTSNPFQILIRTTPLKQSHGTIAIDDVKFRDCNFPQPASSCDYWNQFKCQNGACVNFYQVCNHVDDCGDETDENAETCVKYSMYGFEKGMDDWVQEEIEDHFDWSFVNGKASAQPVLDHTTGFPTGSFAIVTGKHRLDGDRAWLLSPVFEATRNCKMTFYTSIAGNDMVILNVHSRIGLDEPFETKLKANAGNGNYWSFKTLSFSSKEPFQIVLEGILGKGSHHYIAIDDISLSPGCVISTQAFTTEVPPTTKLFENPCGNHFQWQCVDQSLCIHSYQRCDFQIHCDDHSDEADCGACDFESSSCGWRDISKGKHAWHRQNQTFPEKKTFHDKSSTAVVSNSLMTLRDEGSMYSRSSLMKSPEFGYTEPTCHILFYFLNIGPGDLNLYLYPKTTSKFESTDGGSRLWHNKESTQWKRTSVDIGSRAAGFILVFRYDFKRDTVPVKVAIDDVYFSPSCTRGAPPCDFQCKSTDRCVQTSNVCDMAFDCRHGDDEMHCAEYQRYDFERNVGDFRFDSSSNFYWKRTSWGNKKSSGFPGRDHTQGTSQGYYLAIPMTMATSQSIHTTRMESPVFYPNHNRKCMLRFFLYNGGNSMADIQIFTKTYENGELVKKWDMNSVSANRWTRISVVLDTTRAFRAVIQGTRKPGYRGGLAIDDVSFTPECIDTKLTRLQPTPPKVDPGQCVEGKEFSCDFKCLSIDYLCDFVTQCKDGTDEAYCPAQCDFESGLCSWILNKDTEMLTMGFGGFYGYSDHSVGNTDGHFLIAKSIGRERESKVSSPLYTRSGPNCSILFWYKVVTNKKAMGLVDLRVTLSRLGYEQMLSAIETDGGSRYHHEWTRASVDLPPCAGPFQLSFHVDFSNTSSHASVLIDDVSFDNCGNQMERKSKTCPGAYPFQCDDGRCISLDRVCDLRKDCCDNSDEDNRACYAYTKFTFATGLEGWTNDAGYFSNWGVHNTLKRGVIDRQFPLHDHTDFDPSGKYLTISGSTSKQKLATAALVKEMPKSSPACSVTFWYQISGGDASLSSLLVRIRTKQDGQIVNLKNITEVVQRNEWLKDSVIINIDEAYELIFEGIQCSDSHISLDDIVFSPYCNTKDDDTFSTSKPTIPSVSETTNLFACHSSEFQCISDRRCINRGFVCNFRSDCSDMSDEATCGTIQECEFDEDTCFFSNSISQGTMWKTTGTLSELPSIAPAFDAHGYRGNYIFVHGDGNTFGKTEISVLSSPMLGSSGVNCILRFYYLARSFHDSTLSLVITNTAEESTSTALWQTHQSSAFWTLARVGIGRQISPFRLSFLVSSLKGEFQGFVALDRFHYEQCSLPRTNEPCGYGSFTCDDGACVRTNTLCDLQADCEDGSDERYALCHDQCAFDFHDRRHFETFQPSRLGKLSWTLWDGSMTSPELAPGVDHTTNTAEGKFLYATGSPSISGNSTQEEAWLFSPELRATNVSSGGCEVTLYAFIPTANQSLRIGVNIMPDQHNPRAAMDIGRMTERLGHFWQKVSFRILERRWFRLVFIATPGSSNGFIGIDDVIFGPGCGYDTCSKADDDDDEAASRNQTRPANVPGVYAASVDSNSKPVIEGLILPIIGSILAVVAVTVITTGIVVYLYTMGIIGSSSTRTKKKEEAKDKGSPGHGYWSMDDNGSVDGEMFERSSVSI